MKKGLILLLSLAFLQAQSQKAQQFSTAPYTLGKYLIVFVEPAALGDFVNGSSFRGGIEYGLNNNWALSATAGAYLQNGYIIKGELKRYLNDAPNRAFLSLEYKNLWHVYTARDYVRKRDSIDMYVPDKDQPVNYNVERVVNQLSIKYGRTHFMNHNLVFEWYAGAGVRFKSAHTNQDQSELYHYHESMAAGFSYTPGKVIYPGFTLGVKVGRVFL
ncbi:MAG: hypothetical protein QM731_00170 [Chitinophagaceae bacterium]